VESSARYISVPVGRRYFPELREAKLKYQAGKGRVVSWGEFFTIAVAASKPSLESRPEFARMAQDILPVGEGDSSGESPVGEGDSSCESPEYRRLEPAEEREFKVQMVQALNRELSEASESVSQVDSLEALRGEVEGLKVQMRSRETELSEASCDLIVEKLVDRMKLL